MPRLWPTARWHRRKAHSLARIVETTGRYHHPIGCNPRLTWAARILSPWRTRLQYNTICGGTISVSLIHCWLRCAERSDVRPAVG